MALLLKGKQVVDSLAESMRARVDALRSLGVEPALAIVRVGECPDDLSYERTAMKRAESLGVAVRRFVLPADAAQNDVLETIAQINADDSLHGCLMFRPLPQGMDEEAACNALLPEKDVDGVSAASLAAVFTDSDAGFPPCTAAACVAMLDGYGISVEGKHVVVVGRSLVIGKPVAMMLLRRNASVTVCHSRSQNLAEICRMADIVVCATGRARAFGAEFFRPGQTVLDVGINFDEEGRMCGDVDFEAVEPVVDAITPVPGGIGSVTTSLLISHVVESAGRRALQA